MALDKKTPENLLNIMPRKKQQISDSIEQEDSGEQDEANSLPD